VEIKVILTKEKYRITLLKGMYEERARSSCRYKAKETVLASWVRWSKKSTHRSSRCHAALVNNPPTHKIFWKTG
jgi:hypothetical protein